MSATTPGEVLRRLSDPGTTWPEAEALLASLDDQEVEAVLAAFAWLHDARAEAEVHAAVQLLSRWADRPVAQALPPALHALLDEPGVADLNKLAAADLLAALGQPVARGELLSRLRDPSALARSAAAAALAATAAPGPLVNLLDALSREPRDLVLALIEDLVALDDDRALALLAPLAQVADPEVALTAVIALDELQVPEAAATLALVAVHHPDETVRDQADLALRRLPVADGGAAGRPDDPPLATAYLTDRDDRGRQVVVLARAAATDPAALDILTVAHTATAGVVEYAAAERLTPAELGRLVARLGQGGRQVRAVPPGMAAWQLEVAAVRTLVSGGAAAVGYAAWPQLLGPVAPEAPPADFT